jgi:hypothetical protein
MNPQLNDKLDEIIAKCGAGGVSVELVTLLTGMMAQMSILQAKVDSFELSQNGINWGDQNNPLSYTPENVANKIVAISTLTAPSNTQYPTEEAVVSFVDTHYASSVVVDTILDILEQQSSDFKILAEEVLIIQNAITGSPPV